MITITNSKVSGFSPRWSEYRGFSLLFDNPFDDGNLGMSFNYISGLLKVNCSMYNTELKLYRTFKESLDRIGLDLLTNTYLFCTLPPGSYHVTVWDGVNRGNVEDIPDDMDFRNFLNNLPYSISKNTDFTELINSSLLAQTAVPITFKFYKLTRWDKVLVARLKPYDEKSENVYTQIKDNRKELNKSFKEQFGIKPSRSRYLPHVSLGYFANSEIAELAEPQIAGWTEEIKSVLKEKNHPTITFNSISLYGFTDMATFFKKV